MLRSVKARALCVGFTTDVRYPVELQKDLARHIPGAQYAEIDSIHGHDAFLIEFDALGALIREFLDRTTGSFPDQFQKCLAPQFNQWPVGAGL